MTATTEHPPHMQAYIDMINKSESNFEDFKLTQHLKLPDVVPQDLSAKNVIITGANAGLGYETAKSIASMKPQTLILACRNVEKAKEAADSIKSETGCTTIEIEELDLASFASTIAFVNRILARNIAIDVLISNAGIASLSDWVVTKDGYEIQLQVNHLSNVLMVVSLIPALQKSKEPRVEIVASGNHFWPPLPEPNDPHPVLSLLTKSEKNKQQYPSTKLLNVLFTHEFAWRFPDIFICSSNPGYCNSELGVKNLETGGDKKPKTNSFGDSVPMRSTADGAKTLVYAAISPEANESGAYYSDMQAKQPRSTTLGEGGRRFAANVWNDTMDILSKVDGNSLFKKNK